MESLVATPTEVQWWCFVCLYVFMYVRMSFHTAAIQMMTTINYKCTFHLLSSLFTLLTCLLLLRHSQKVLSGIDVLCLHSVVTYTSANRFPFQSTPHQLHIHSTPTLRCWGVVVEWFQSGIGVGVESVELEKGWHSWSIIRGDTVLH